MLYRREASLVSNYATKPVLNGKTSPYKSNNTGHLQRIEIIMQMYTRTKSQYDRNQPLDQ